MNARRNVLLATIFLFFFTVAGAIAVSAQTQSLQSVELQDVGFTSSDMAFGPGSDIPLQCPLETGYAWISSVEPNVARWKIYDPTFHLIYTFEHPPAFKKKITQGEYAGKWAFADSTSFTVPAFAKKGSWLAKPEFVLADGTVVEGVSAENPEAKYLALPVTLSGSVIDNIFIAPNYFFGIKFPALFWFPLSLLWIPALIVLVAIIYTRSISGAVDLFKGMARATREAKKEWARP